MGVPSAKFDDHREDVRLLPPAQIARLVEASAAFTLPEGLDKSDSATLFLTGSTGDAAHPPLGGSASGTDAQRSRRGRSRYGPRVAPALSGPLLAHRRRLALRYGPATRDRIAEFGSSLIAGKLLRRATSHEDDEQRLGRCGCRIHHGRMRRMLRRAPSRASAATAKSVPMSSLLAPEHASPVYVDDLRGYSMFRAVVGDSLLTRLHRLVVVNDAETPG